MEMKMKIPLPPEEHLSPVFGGICESGLTEDDKVLPKEPVITSEDPSRRSHVAEFLELVGSLSSNGEKLTQEALESNVLVELHPKQHLCEWYLIKPRTEP